jgi:hypothetical protein
VTGREDELRTRRTAVRVQEERDRALERVADLEGELQAVRGQLVQALRASDEAKRQLRKAHEELGDLGDAYRCKDLTKSPRGYLRCNLKMGHDADPLSFHRVDPADEPVKCTKDGNCLLHDKGSGNFDLTKKG